MTLEEGIPGGWSGICAPGTQARTPHPHEQRCIPTWPSAFRPGGGVEGAGQNTGLLEGVPVPGELMSLGGGTLKYKLLSPQGRAPRRGYEGDAGLDLAAAQDVMIYAGRYARVDLDIAVQLPEWCGSFMMSRSSLARRELWLMQTLIDAGYRGPLFCMIFNIGEHAQQIHAGERIAQLVPFEAVGARFEIVEVEELDPSERGSNAFGSTGR